MRSCRKKFLLRAGTTVFSPSSGEIFAPAPDFPWSAALAPPRSAPPRKKEWSYCSPCAIPRSAPPGSTRRGAWGGSWSARIGRWTRRTSPALPPPPLPPPSSSSPSSETSSEGITCTLSLHEPQVRRHELLEEAGRPPSPAQQGKRPPPARRECGPPARTRLREKHRPRTAGLFVQAEELRLERRMRPDRRRVVLLVMLLPGPGLLRSAWS